MNEAETRAEHIDPALAAAGWGVVEGSRVHREFPISDGKILLGGGRAKPLKADYVLSFNGRKLAAMEAKAYNVEVGEGVRQAKDYADKLKLQFTYAVNGREIYQINMQSGAEGLVSSFPSPQELWDRIFPADNNWRDRFNNVPPQGNFGHRYYQEIAINRALDVVADGRDRILLTLATGTGKTVIAFQIAWKLFQTRWNLQRDGRRRPRILFLADRNILADQAFNAFNAFPDDALVRIRPDEIKKQKRVPTNGSIFFTIFQTFMSGTDANGRPAPYFGAYPKDFFDFIIIDECHRGGANDESNWRDIMEYFSPAVQLGLTATPKREVNADTYRYFGEPVYIYSLKEGINDGFLTPFKVKRIQTTLDEYIYTSDDEVVEGEIEEGRVYQETDFNRIIEIKAREEKRVSIYMQQANQTEKAIVFCANQEHAAAIRDIINQQKSNPDPFYCVRVTANDGKQGEQYLREFQDNEKTIPTILTTSQKLSTGVDARNVRNIVLLRPINSMIEFKQIIGRGTRLFDGKHFFTIYDYVNAYQHFLDPEWDGEPIEPVEPVDVDPKPVPPNDEELPVVNDDGDDEDPATRRKIKVKLRDGKEREIQHMTSTSFWSPDGRPLSAAEFMESLFGSLPTFFNSEDELRQLWSNPQTREQLLQRLTDAGYGRAELMALQELVNAENSDLFDVLEYIAYNVQPITREERVANSQRSIYNGLSDAEKEFLDFVLLKYIESGVDELAQEKLPALLLLKYNAFDDAAEALGGLNRIRETFVGFQRHLYQVQNRVVA